MLLLELRDFVGEQHKEGPEQEEDEALDHAFGLFPWLNLLLHVPLEQIAIAATTPLGYVWPFCLNR